MLRNRILTALTLAPLIIVAIVALPINAFILFTGFVVMLAAWEFAKIADLKHNSFRICYGMIVVLLFLLLRHYPLLTLLSGLIGLLWSSFGILKYERSTTACGIQFPYTRVFLGIISLLSFWVAMTYLRIHFGGWCVLFIIVVVWIMDIGGYIAGKKWGKHLLVPKVSPKKTLEGLWGGIILVLLFMSLVLFLISMPWKMRFVYGLLGLIAALSSVLGDLVVSLFKRISGVKDTGRLLPGHGGILDRIDSCLAGVVIFALGLLLLGHA